MFGFLAETFERVKCQRRNVVLARSQRRQLNWKDVDAVIQVIPKIAVGYHRFKIPVGGTDQANVDGLRARVTDCLEFALLDKPEELGLRRHGNVANLIQEQRPTVGGLEKSLLVGHRPGE